MKKFTELIEKNDMAYDKLQQVRRDLTDISSNLSSVRMLAKKNNDKKTIDISNECQELIDKARTIIFNYHK